MAPGLAPGHYRWTQTVPDLNCLAIFGPRPPQPRRAARRARSSGPTLVPSPAAPAPRSLSVLRHAGSAELCTRGEIHEICHSGSEEEKRNVIEICHTRFEIMASKFPMAAFRNSGRPQLNTCMAHLQFFISVIFFHCGDAPARSIHVHCASDRVPQYLFRCVEDFSAALHVGVKDTVTAR